jgi:hypothetical protein
MPNIWVPEAYAALTVNGSATGYITVADNTLFYPTAEVVISSATEPGRKAVITDLVGTTQIGLRYLQDFPAQNNRYGRDSMAIFHIADQAVVCQPGQIVRVNDDYSKWGMLPSGGTPYSHFEAGNAPMTGVEVSYSVVFASPFGAADYYVTVTQYETGGLGPVALMITTKTVNGFIVVPSAPFTGEISWSAFK